jgi:hypothetical protein
VQPHLKNRIGQLLIGDLSELAPIVQDIDPNVDIVDQQKQRHSFNELGVLYHPMGVSSKTNRSTSSAMSSIAIQATAV